MDWLNKCHGDNVYSNNARLCPAPPALTALYLVNATPLGKGFAVNSGI